MLKAVRLKCLDCSGDSADEVRLCPVTECALYPFRFGKMPEGRRRKVSEAQREAFRQRMQEYREKAA